VNTVLELRALTKHYPTHRAVNSVSLALEKGKFFSLLGPSGCGKTTTLRLIAGFETPTAGEILLNGEPVAGRRPYQRNVSTVFQNYALFPHLTVADNISFGLERRGATRSQIRAQVDAMLELVQLSGKGDRLPSQISGGERQRVALARSLVLEPDVLLLDEPLSALDPKLRKQMRSELKSLQRRVGVTFLFITHDQEEAMSLSDRMAVMNAGRIEQIGTPQELYRNPQSRFVAEFLGDVNWIGGAAVRPESLQVSHARPAGRPAALEGAITGITYLGNCVNIDIRLDGDAHCTAQVGSTRHRYQVGDVVHVWWEPEDQLPILIHTPAVVPA
jgi:ABC-type Fe3+/spermidine/putrescine transport system ATPase subunit